LREQLREQRNRADSIDPKTRTQTREAAARSAHAGDQPWEDGAYRPSVKYRVAENYRGAPNRI
jgi:hypothetical protein